MLTADISKVSEEVENYLRLHLLTKISTRAVRLIFDKEFHPDCLEATIKKAHGKLYDLKKKRVINAAQWNLLFPGSGDPPPKSKSFDVILMVILIRNLADPTSSAAGYDRLPLSTDISCTADLARIKHYRNQLSHCEDGKIESAFFTTAWESISGAIKRLGGPDMDRECKELRTTHLDHSIVPWNIRLQIRLVLDKWQKNDVNFVETRAAKHVLECLHKSSCVTITASSGVGKTATLQHVVLKMMDEGYDILLVNNPNEIVKFYNPNEKTLFVLDDFCGTYSINQSALNNWETEMNRVKTVIENKMTKVIVACRLQVYKDDKFDFLSIFRTSVCNLLSEELCFSQAEKYSIAEMYLEAKASNIIQYSNLNDCFPLLCKLYHDNPELRIIEFFQNPYSVYEAEMETLKQRGLFHKYCALALCVMFNNRLNEEILTEEIGENLQSIISNTCAVCRLDKFTSRLSLLNECQSLEQTFLKKEDGMYKFIHDKLFDMLSYYFGKNIIQCLINNAHSQFIMERFLLEREENMDQFITVVSRSNHEIYIQRMINDWVDGNVMHVFGNKNMGKQKFRLRILNYLDTFDVSYQRQLAHTVDNIHKDTVILQCCFVGDIQFIQWCCFHEVDINQCRENGESPLYISSEKGHTEVVKILVDNKAFINKCTKDKVSPLYIACQNNHLDIVKLLLDNGADLNKCKKDGASPLFIACQEGYTDIVKLLLNETTDINICRDTGSSPLFIACKNNHSDIVNLLLYNKADIDKSKNDGATPLFIACKEGHIDIVKLLLNGNADINICPNTGLSPKTIAHLNNHYDIVHLFKNIPKGHLNIVKPKPAKIDNTKNVYNSIINRRPDSFFFDDFEMEGPSQKLTSGMKRRTFSRKKASRNTPGGNKGLFRKQVKQKKHSSHDKTLIQLIYHKLNQYIHVYNLQALLHYTIDIDKPTLDYWWGLCSPAINFMCYIFCVWFLFYFLPRYWLFMFDL